MVPSQLAMRHFWIACPEPQSIVWRSKYSNFFPTVKSQAVSKSLVDKMCVSTQVYLILLWPLPAASMSHCDITLPAPCCAQSTLKRSR